MRARAPTQKVLCSTTLTDLAECIAGETGMAVAFPPPFVEEESKVSMSLTAANCRPLSVDDGSAASAGLSILESDEDDDGEARNDIIVAVGLLGEVKVRHGQSPDVAYDVDVV